MSIYWIIVILILVFGYIMPQEGPQRKYYIFLMNAIHTFVCAFRYQYLTGDLIKYHTTYRHLFAETSYFSKWVIDEWRNTGWRWLMKAVADLTNGNYTIFLVVLAVFCCTVAAVFIYRFSPKPWFSYLVWNCMQFYLIYDFLAIKQGVAMAILMIAMVYIFDRRPVAFVITTLIAGMIHQPALCFLPAYFLANRSVDFKLILTYCVIAALIYASRTPIVNMIGELYYEDITFVLRKEELGGRTIVVILMLIAGWFLKGFRENQFTQLFNIMVAAAILQSFSGFNNIFTRLADYYLQFSVLYIPMIVNRAVGGGRDLRGAWPIFPFNQRSLRVIAGFLVLIMIWWYDTTCLGHTTSGVDDYLNYRFIWDVGTKWFW